MMSLIWTGRSRDRECRCWYCLTHRFTAVELLFFAIYGAMLLVALYLGFAQ